ncbi:MAG: uroporphyrinogen-III C-methyltransferase [Dehalococcoidia bacterium]
MSASQPGGFVSLVGAGPGDPGLITVAGRERLRNADVVVFDRLASPALLTEIRPDAERIDVGKAASAHTLPQEQIGRLLVARARAGKRVVRLKGGDPFVFGRGGEEAQELAEAGIEFEIVPGVTSAVAVPAYAGIPLTHRSLASSFAVITGHEDPTKNESTIDWAGVARGADTLLFLMGRSAIGEITARLVAEGRNPATPAAAIQWGTTPRQRCVTASLETLPSEVERAGLEPPVVIVVGEVVRLRERLRWFEQRPLFGKRVLVTRTREQASVLVRYLAEEGAEPLELPAIEIVPADAAPICDAVASLAAGDYQWVVFTSANGVHHFFRHLVEQELDSRAFAGARVAVIGSETAQALRSYGLRADLAPERFVAEALVERFSEEPLADTRILLARAAHARDLLPGALRERGAHVDDVALYAAQRPTTPNQDIVRRLEAGDVDIATFTASSTVTGCLDLLAGRTEPLEKAFIACIGPVTAQTAREAGLRVDLVSEVHTIPGLVSALRTHYGKVAAHA